MSDPYPTPHSSGNQSPGSQSPVAFSIVIPCYNEVGAIEDTLREIESSVFWPDPYEVIVVNDGSRDGSTEVLERLAEELPKLRVLHHARNRGYGAALKSGIAVAYAPIIVITDADGTYPNHRIPEFVEGCANFEMVIGSRTADDVEYSKIRSIPKFFLKRWVSWLAGQPVPDMNSGLRAFRRSTIEHFIGIMPDGFSFTTTSTLAFLTNFRPVQFLPIGYKTRIGKSKIKPIRDTLRFSMLILRTGMYFAPLRLLSPVIALFALLSLGSLAYDVFWVANLSDKTTLLFMLTFNTALFALLADMIDKRTR